MRIMPLGKGEMSASVIALGLWRLWKSTPVEAEALVKTALDEEITFFDHADIYGNGRSETMFADVAGITPSLREKIQIQSKCGIVRREEGAYFDFSTDRILASVDGILKRLKTEYLDSLVLHRPDALGEPEEVAAAFDILHAAGKVRHFGVSNHRPGQIRLLQKYVNQRLMLSQLQFSLTNSSILDPGLCTNMEIDQAVDHDGDILDFCRLHDITIQAWSPFQYGVFEGVFLDNPKFPELNKKLHEIADAHSVATNAVAVAWILRHPARIHAIVGTTKAARLKEICKAASVTLTRPEWYDLWRAAGNMLP